MSLFSSLVGDVVGLGLDIIGTNKTKKAINTATGQQVEGFEAGIDEARAFSDQVRADVSPFIEGGQQSQEALLGLLLGGDRLAPTQAEIFAREDAQRAIDRAASAGGNILSGERLRASGDAAARIGSQFRQQDISNLFGLTGQGLSATGTAASAAGTSTANIIDLLNNIGRTRAAGTLGKNQATQALLGEIGNTANSTIDFFSGKPKVG